MGVLAVVLQSPYARITSCNNSLPHCYLALFRFLGYENSTSTSAALVGLSLKHDNGVASLLTAMAIGTGSYDI